MGAIRVYRKADLIIGEGRKAKPWGGLPAPLIARVLVALATLRERSGKTLERTELVRFMLAARQGFSALPLVSEAILRNRERRETEAAGAGWEVPEASAVGYGKPLTKPSSAAESLRLWLAGPSANKALGGTLYQALTLAADTAAAEGTAKGRADAERLRETAELFATARDAIGVVPID